MQCVWHLKWIRLQPLAPMQHPYAVSFWYAMSVWYMVPSMHRWYPVSIGGTQYPSLGAWVSGGRQGGSEHVGYIRDANGCCLDHLRLQPVMLTTATWITYGCSLLHLWLQPGSPMVAASCAYGCSLLRLWLQGRRRARWCRADADHGHLHPYRS